MAKNERELARLERIRVHFSTQSPASIVGYWERHEAIVLFRKWAKLVGDYPSVNAADRFLKFVNGDDHATA